MNAQNNELAILAKSLGAELVLFDGPFVTLLGKMTVERLTDIGRHLAQKFPGYEFDDATYKPGALGPECVGIRRKMTRDETWKYFAAATSL